MRMIELLPEKGNFYKVNMHSHSTLSDGKLTPEEMKEAYKRRGYSAICFTDHEVLIGHKELCDDTFIALHGYEVGILNKKIVRPGMSGFTQCYHFNMIAKEQDNLTMPGFYKNNPYMAGSARQTAEQFGKYADTIEENYYDVAWINTYLKKFKDNGFLVVLNHPEWSIQNCNDYLGLEHLHGIEVINGSCAQAYSENTGIHYQQLLRAGHCVVPTAGDDDHDTKDHFNAWTMIKAEELSYDALIKAYEKGDCYASEGPDILSIVFRDNKIIVKTSPVCGIFLRGEGRHTEYVYSRTETYTEAEFEFLPNRFGRFFRIEIRDKEGFRAFSNAYYTEKILEG